MNRKIIIAGAGTGSVFQLTPEVKNLIDDADIIFSDKRFNALIPEYKRVIDIKNYSELEIFTGKILILVSGDPGIFSLMSVIKKRYPDEDIEVLPGISSLQVICSKAKETWNDAAILSGHGRSLSVGKFLNMIERNRITVLFCDKNISPSWACKNSRIIDDIDIFIGSCLGSDNEIIFSGKPEDFSNREFPEPSIILIRNNSVYKPERLNLRDKDFIRENDIVMTNEAVRSVILSRLEINNDCIIWDIGAGSGSISVSIANQFPYSEIHATECNPKAADLISRNASKFHLHNINIHNARTLEIIDTLPKPSRIFIGGTNGELSGILERISLMNNAVRLVIACVTLETFTEAYEIMRNWENFEAVQISAVLSKPLNTELTLMKANNPVMILSAEK